MVQALQLRISCSNAYCEVFLFGATLTYSTSCQVAFCFVMLFLTHNVGRVWIAATLKNT